MRSGLRAGTGTGGAPLRRFPSGPGSASLSRKILPLGVCPHSPLNAPSPPRFPPVPNLIDVFPALLALLPALCSLPPEYLASRSATRQHPAAAARPGPPPVSAGRALREHGHARPGSHLPWLLSWHLAEPSRCDRDPVAREASTTLSLALHGELADPVL